MTLTLSVDAKDPLPLWAQLERGIRAAVATGRLKPGGQLPTVRQLAVQLSVNANTVARVYADLEKQGFLETRRGVGTFVGEPVREEARADRGRALRAFVDRVLAEASRAGFSSAEMVEHVAERARKERTR
jgi:GntR family transcriptional regulator